jgi:hypothetical protein
LALLVQGTPPIGPLLGLLVNCYVLLQPNTGAIAGIAIGAFLCLVLCIVGCVCLCRQCAKRNETTVISTQLQPQLMYGQGPYAQPQLDIYPQQQYGQQQPAAYPPTGQEYREQFHQQYGQPQPGSAV